MIEMTRNNIRIDPLLDVDPNWVPPSVVAYIEMWFDVDEKFGTNTYAKPDTWINLYAMYDPIGHELSLEFYIESDNSSSEPIRYKPTEAEKAVIMELIEEKCREVEGCSCEDYMLEGGC